MSYTEATKLLNGRLIVPYQRDGVQWMIEREDPKNNLRGGFLCDEMGLGKTVQLITTMLARKMDRTLVVVPKSLVDQWVAEVEKFAPHLKVGKFDGPKRMKMVDTLTDYDVVVTPYTAITPREKLKDAPIWTPIHDICWDRLILDEAHEIRNPKAKVTKSVCSLKSAIRWVVTGTPVFNSMKDFVSLCGFFGFEQKFVQAKYHHIREAYVMRRTKAEIAKVTERVKLPPCEFDNIELDMNKEEKDVYSDVFREAQEYVKDVISNGKSMALHSFNILEKILRCRQVLVSPQVYYDAMDKGEWVGRSTKFDKLSEMVNEHPKEKTLIFCQFITEMNIIEKMFRDQGKDVFRIDGSVSGDDRTERVLNFKKISSGAVFIIQTKSGGQGLNLQEATRVYITTPAWNPATELQAIGRSHRTGQTKTVKVSKLIYTGYDDIPSIEQTIMMLQGHKSKVCAEVLNDDTLLSQIPVTNHKKLKIADLKGIFNLNKPKVS